MSLSIIVTISAIFCWAILSVTSRVLLINFEFDPWMFSFIQLCAGGIILLAASGRSGLKLSSLTRPSTWILGVLRVLSAALYTAVLAWISVLEAGILGALNMPVIALAVWVVTKHRPSRFEWSGHLLVLLAVLALAAKLESDLRAAALGLMAINAVCLAAMNLLAEHHPDNISDEPGVRTRFTGAVLLVTAVLFATGRILQQGPVDATANPTLIVAGVLVGIILRAPAMLLAFWSIRLAGAQGYTVAISLLPIFGMAFEQAAVAMKLLTESRFQIETVYLAGIVIAGTMVILAARRQDARRLSP